LSGAKRQRPPDCESTEELRQLWTSAVGQNSEGSKLGVSAQKKEEQSRCAPSQKTQWNVEKELQFKDT